MITIDVSALPGGNWKAHGGNEVARLNTRKMVYGPLISPNAQPANTSYQLEVGSISTGKKTWGQLRDRSCKHMTASGTLTVPLGSLQQGTQDGYPYAFAAGSSTKVLYSTTLCWGQAFEWLETVPVAQAMYPPDLGVYTCPDGMRTSYTAHWEGDKLLLAWTTINGTIYRNGLVNQASSIVTRIFRYVRGSGANVGKIHYVGMSGILYRVPTGADLSTNFAAITVPWNNFTTQTQYQSGASTTPELVLSYVSSAVQAQFEKLDLFSEAAFTDFGQLAIECAKQLRYVDRNVLGLIFDVTEWRNIHSLWKNLTTSAPWQAASAECNRVFRQHKGNWRSYRRITRPVASVYLGTKYGVLPTSDDVRRLFQGIRKFSSFRKKQRLHSRRVTSVVYPDACYGLHTAVLTVQCGQFSDDVSGKAMKVIAGMKAFGMYPETVNLWDRLAYSFVLDWFVQFGDLFEDVDWYLNVKDYFPVDYCVLSEKWSKGVTATSMVPANMPATGIVEFSYYTRWISGSVPLPTVSLNAKSSADKHLTEAAALILVR